MLTPRLPATPSEVARHYDELGGLYCHLWGEHLHHGAWEEPGDRSSIEEATTRLLRLVIAPLRLRSGSRLLDIGCGYGVDARWIAETFGAYVTGLTLSAHQAEIAQDQPPPTQGRLEIHLGDWLTNDYPDHSFDSAIAIESLAHVPNKPAFFHQLARTVAPGGRAAIACWTADPNLCLFERILLRRICRDGRLPSLGTLDEYRNLAISAGLRVTGHRDLTDAVEPTWWIIARRSVISLFTSLRLFLAALQRTFRRPSLLLAIPPMLLAYRTGALQYHLLWLQRPAVS